MLDKERAGDYNKGNSDFEYLNKDLDGEKAEDAAFQRAGGG